jgi:hypothetical protein
VLATFNGLLDPKSGQHIVERRVVGADGKTVFILNPDGPITAKGGQGRVLGPFKPAYRGGDDSLRALKFTVINTDDDLTRARLERLAILDSATHSIRHVGGVHGFSSQPLLVHFPDEVAPLPALLSVLPWAGNVVEPRCGRWQGRGGDRQLIAGSDGARM